MDTATLTLVAPLLVLAFVAVSVVLRQVRAGAARRGASGWATTTGTVVASSVVSRRTGKTRHESPAVVYTYQVDGRPLQGTTVRVGDELGRIRVAGTSSSAAETVARYPAGATVTVHYDPAEPTRCALER